MDINSGETKLRDPTAKKAPQYLSHQPPTASHQKTLTLILPRSNPKMTKMTMMMTEQTAHPRHLLTRKRKMQTRFLRLIEVEVVAAATAATDTAKRQLQQPNTKPKTSSKTSAASI